MARGPEYAADDAAADDRAGLSGLGRAGRLGMCDCAPEAPLPVTDWACGDVICERCGVVVEGHILDETPEWRNHEHGGPDKSRVGAPVSVLDATSRAFTACQGTYLALAGGRRVCASASRMDPGEAALLEGLRLVEQLVAGMGLLSTCAVAVTAKELFSDINASKPVRSDCRRAMAAAAVYYAFKLEGSGREMRLVCQVCHVSMKALNAATSEFKDQLRDKAYYSRLFAPLQAGKLIDLFLDRLRLAPEERKRVWRAASQLDEQLVDLLDCGRKPRTICSGLLYLACLAEKSRVGKPDIAGACGVCQQTLDKVVAHIRELLA